MNSKGIDNYICKLKSTIANLEKSTISLDSVREIEEVLQELKNDLKSKNTDRNKNKSNFFSPINLPLLEKIIENNPMAIGIANSQARFVKANKAFHDLFGSIPPKSYCFFEDPVILKSKFVGEIDRLKQGNTVCLPELWYNPHWVNPRYPSKEICISSMIIPFYNHKNVVENYILFQQDLTEIKLAERALLASERKYKQIFENIQSIYYECTLEGIITEVSPQVEQISGYSREELLGMNLSNIYYDYSKRENTLEILNREGVLKNHIIELKSKNGMIHKGLVNSRVVFDENSKPCGIAGSIVDITEKERVEEELNKTRERYQELFESTSDVVYTMDFQGNFTSVNPVAEKVLGYKFEELHYPNMRDFISPEANKIATEFIYKKLRGEADSTTYEVEFIKKDGTYTTFEINSFLRYKEGKPFEVFGIARDISDRRKSEQKLKLNEEKYRMIFENAPLGIMICDTEGNIIEINESLLHMLGSSSMEETRKINILQFPPLVKSGVTDVFKRCMQTNTLQISKHEYVSKWGKVLMSRVYSKPTCDNTGTITGFQAIIEDITEEIEAEKLMTKNMLEKEALLREIHHRVKNNLQIIISLINMQMIDIEDTHSQQKFKELQQRVRTMSIIHEDLYMSKNLAEVNFGNYIQRLTVNLKQIYHNNEDIDLHFSLMEYPLQIDTAIPLGLIINELVSNAYKHAFIEKDTKSKNKKKNFISIEFSVTNNEFVLIVMDNGKGFSVDELDKQNETLGLSLVDILVSQLKGSYFMKNSSGTRYEIRIPAIN